MRNTSRLFRALLCAALLSAACAAARAQETQANARVELRLTGGKGSAAPELAREDVRVYVDGVERPVVSFEKETRKVSYGLVVDNSGSLRSQAGEVMAAAKFVVGRNGPGDETFVERFVSADNIQILQPLTSDPALLNRALDSMRIQAGQTALLDALYRAADYLTKKAGRAGAGGRELALVLVSDGEDRQSAHKAAEVLKLLKEGGVRVFCVGLTAVLENDRRFVSQSKRDAAVSLLSKLAGETGGRVYYVEERGQLQEVVGDVVGGLRTRYLVGYAPPDAGARGPGKVEVKLSGAAAKAKLKAEVLKDSSQ